MFRRLMSSLCANFLTVAYAIAILVAVDLAPVATAQEAADPGTDVTTEPTAESKYFDLRHSKDRLTQQIAERYFNLVKLQEWSSDKGTTIKAKYVSHSPDLKLVTLAIVKGHGADRVETEKAVPVARLSKTGQSRVKQIATIQKRLDELIAGGATGEPGQPGAVPSADPGSPMVDERGEQPRTRRPSAVRRPAGPDRDEPATTRPAAVSSADDGEVDPLGFGELPANPASQVAAAPTTIVPPGIAVPGPSRTAKAIGKDAWRTDYEAFRAILTANGERPQADLGAIKELEAAAQFVTSLDSVGDAEHAAIAKKFAEVGEFSWEATLTDADVASGDWTDRLNLPPLAEPLTIDFILDPDRPPGNWQKFKAGDRVRFVGRFVDFANDSDLVAAIRFPDDAPAANAPFVPGLEPETER